jgi:hypothetical protein
MQLAGFAMDEERHRDAPLTLTRQRPVRTIGDHRVQTLLAPRRKEACRFDAFECRLTQRLAAILGHNVHAGEPLRCGAIDDRRLVAPAMHVAVRVLVLMQQRTGLIQRFDDLRIGLPYEHAAEQRQRRSVMTIAHHRIDDVGILHAVRFARQEVFHAVRRRRVHDAGTGIERHVIAEIHRRQTRITRIDVVQRMTEAQITQRAARCGRDDMAFQTVGLQALFHALGGENQQALRRIDEAVAEIRMQVERLVGGNRPRRGRPDHDHAVGLGKFFQPERFGDRRRIVERKAHVDRDVCFVFVFDFRFGQRRTAIEAPVHRLQPR